MDQVLLFSKCTSVGLFEIRTPHQTFDITAQTYGCTYTLHLDTLPEHVRTFPDPYDGIRAVAEHRTGIPCWDSSNETISDYALDWTKHVNKKFKMQLLGKYLEHQRHWSCRKLVDYFEHKHPYALDRASIGELLEELAVTGQLERPLDDFMVPSELRSLSMLIKRWHDSA